LLSFVLQYFIDFMNYQGTLDFLFNSLPMFQRIGQAAYKADLSNSLAFDKHLNFPHRSFKSIHVAGTNGKGSTSHMLASIFQAAGYKTGLYTSPHLSDFRERIKIDGQMVRPEFVTEFIADNREFIDQVKPSFFEMTVFMAFDYFRSEQVDIAIVETGMGGRLDSTNVITPELSVITNISLDHMQFLGETLPLIAIEKAGIIKPKIPVVVGQYDQAYASVFEQMAREKDSSIRFADLDYNCPLALKSIDQKQIFDIYKGSALQYPQLKLDLLGFYQQKNILTVVAAFEQIKAQFKLDTAHLYQALAHAAEQTGLQGRWQILSSNPMVVCDTGHNQDGIKWVLDQIEQTPYRNLHMVWGMVGDKSIDKILEMLPKQATYYFTQAQIPRALDANELAQKGFDIGLKGNVYANVSNALDAAKQSALAQDLIFVGGSTFVVAEVV